MNIAYYVMEARVQESVKVGIPIAMQLHDNLMCA